ncbi:L-threonylcarbamoyladenylate synthase [Candidatus Pelagibacter sp.]|nr:L-threonylcarbamoyladenylate synthase [Candidatus Pelagibacter sp.]|tara:strand:- start:1245 stop:2177 length:933 start_codon:yes stop_codon:yes gene_type:complete
MKNDLSNIKKAIKFLNKNHCVGIPTETVYGLAANAYSSNATAKIFKLKKRPKKNPLIVHYFNLQLLKKDCEINDNFLKLYKKYSPGPISYILKLKKKSLISKNVTSKKNTLAVRFPSHRLTRNLLKQLNYPLAAPSANISTKISPVSKKDVKDEFGKKVKLILDGGQSKIGVESTIINLIKKPQILRLGGIPKEDIKKYLNSHLAYIKKSKINSPGQETTHYSPYIRLRLNIKKPNRNEAFILIKKRKKMNKNYFYLSKKNNLKEAAKNLYKTLRYIKKRKYKSIAVEKIPNKGFGEVINDRLKRASNFK